MKSLKQAAAYFGNLAAGGYKRNLTPILHMLGDAVKTESVREIGRYNGGVGPYPATAPLAPATLERRARAGLNPSDMPLWASGKYHDGIGTAPDVNTLSVEIGSHEKYVIFSELGTKNEPPRPIFGPATLRAVPPLLPKVSRAAALGIAGGIWKGLSVEGTAFAQTGEHTSLAP